jgi:tetratricopeptide (TPR) repeat protein
MFDTDGAALLSLARSQALERDYNAALRSFQRAISEIAFLGETLVHPQYLSHYGISLAMASGRREEGRRLCERSIQLEPYEPEHYLNLARIHLGTGNRTAAILACEEGLAICPQDSLLAQELDAMERRKAAVFPLLPRDHPLNRCVGRFLRSARSPRSS